jgi:hypothetical protein
MAWRNTCGMTAQIRTGFYDRIMRPIIFAMIMLVRNSNTVHEDPACHVGSYKILVHATFIWNTEKLIRAHGKHRQL